MLALGMRDKKSNFLENELKSREPIWEALQEFFLDTEPDYNHIAKVCADSDYSINDLKEILFFEIFPALRFNFFSIPGGEWAGFELNWLKDRIQKKHTRNKLFQPLILRGYTKECWSQLLPLIEEARRS